MIGTLDDLPPGLRARLGRRYAFALTHAVPIYAGDEAAVWRVETGSGPVVVRLSPAWRTLDEVQWVHDLLAFAEVRIPEAGAPLATADGARWMQWDGRPVAVFPFVEGVALNREEAPLRREAARLLARVHADLGDWPHRRPRPPPGPSAPALWPELQGQPGPADLPALADSELDVWHAEWRHAARSAGSIPAPVPTSAVGPIHGDYYRRNLLCRGGRIVGLIDWDDARLDQRVVEVAWAAWEFAKVDGGLRLDRERARHFLDDYATAGGELPPDADDAVVPLIRWRLREEIRLAHSATARGLPRPDDDAEYVQRQLRAFAVLRSVRLA